MKLCKNCKYFRLDTYRRNGALCYAKATFIPATLDPVFGRTLGERHTDLHDCETARNKQTLCGPLAGWFKPAVNGETGMLESDSPEGFVMTPTEVRMPTKFMKTVDRVKKFLHW